MIYAALIAAAAALIGSAIAAGDEAKAREIRDKAAREIEGIKLPDLDKAVAEQLPDELKNRYTAITDATRGQSEALRRLNEVVAEKGETVDDKAAYLRSSFATSGQEAGSKAALLRQLAQRGLGGSGVEAALLAGAGQQSIDRGAASNLEQASQARARMLQDIGQQGQLAGQMRGQDMDALRAQDAITLFNARARQDAQQYNLGLSQQGFANEMQLRAAQANAANGVAAGYDSSGARTRRTAAGIGNAAVDFGQAYDKKKKDEEA